MGNINSESSVGVKNNSNGNEATAIELNRLHEQMRQQLITMQRQVHQLTEIQQIQQQIQLTQNLISEMQKNIVENNKFQVKAKEMINDPIE
jgi:hypothetical protein